MEVWNLVLNLWVSVQALSDVRPAKRLRGKTCLAGIVHMNVQVAVCALVFLLLVVLRPVPAMVEPLACIVRLNLRAFACSMFLCSEGSVCPDPRHP